MKLDPIVNTLEQALNTQKLEEDPDRELAPTHDDAAVSLGLCLTIGVWSIASAAIRCRRSITARPPTTRASAPQHGLPAHGSGERAPGLPPVCAVHDGRCTPGRATARDGRVALDPRHRRRRLATVPSSRNGASSAWRSTCDGGANTIRQHACGYGQCRTARVRGAAVRSSRRVLTGASARPGAGGNSRQGRLRTWLELRDRLDRLFLSKP